jgi:D-sedoheptulose 7-phosphate isomerase
LAVGITAEFGEAAVTTADPAAAAFARRDGAGRALMQDTDAVTDAAAAMADRFQHGAALLVLAGGSRAADAAHVAVEFVHPVIMGKRALPALSLAEDPSAHGDLRGPLRLLGRPQDIALGISDAGLVGDGSGDRSVLDALTEARARGLLTVCLGGPAGCADHVLPPRSDDPRIVRELQVTTYHLLWELVHVLLENAVPAAAGPDGLRIEDGCPDGSCITCGDQAIEVTVLQLRDEAMALVDDGGEQQWISVALVEHAHPGDRLLVHAGEAIAVVGSGT